MKKVILFFLISIFILVESDGQILLNRTLRKATNKLEDKLADKLSEAMLSAIEDDIDNSLHEAYEQDSINGNTSESFSEYVTRLSEGVEIPESYSFDVKQLIETTNHKGKKTEMTYLYSKDGNYFGFEIEEKKNHTRTIFDAEKEIMVTYDLKKNTVSALPSMMKFAQKMAQKNLDDYELHTLEKTGKTKRIAGHKCVEYKVESNKIKGNVFIAEDVDINMSDQYMKIFAGYMPKTYSKFDEIKGVNFKSEITEKDNNKTRESTTLDYKEKSFTILTSDYKIENYD